jgi:hypothetical protein
MFGESMDSLDLQEVAARCDLPVRLIRYVLDHKVLPGTPPEKNLHERGKPRSVTEFEAFVIAIAAYLLDAGVRRANVVRAMRELVEMKGTLQLGLGDAPLPSVMAFRKPARLRLGADGGVRSVSLSAAELPGPTVTPGDAAVVIVDVDLAAIRDRLFPKPKRSAHGA